ncbi:hypothetical protein [Demequina sp.]|uniref:hypothetical protein n=1 Tax=Demequina sp. TaxID=2050685 RepID=UPI003A8B0E0B
MHARILTRAISLAWGRFTVLVRVQLHAPALVLAALCVAMALGARTEVIRTVGPLVFEPGIPWGVAVGALGATATAMACTPSLGRVVTRTARSVVLRCLMFLIPATALMAAIALAAALTPSLDFLAGARSYLAFGAVALAACAALGVHFSWLPVVILFGSGVLSPLDAGPWSPFGLVIDPESSASRTGLVAIVFGVSLMIAAYDPANRDHLPGGSLRRAQRREVSSAARKARSPTT